MPEARIAAIAVTTGARSINLDDELAYYGGDVARLNRLKKATGLQTRWVTEPGTTALDLGEQAARRVLLAAGLEPEALGAVVFVTQTPDHFQPCNAALLHGRLGLAKHAATWDINQGCAGWICGLIQAASWVRLGNKPVLLLAGDTLSLQTTLRARAAAPLFGDGVSATLVEPSPGARWFCDLNTDGSGSGAICVPAGGLRRPVDASTGILTADAEGNERCAEHLFLDGAEVFKFTLREVPTAIEQLLAYAGQDKDAIDHWFLHQANGFILDNLRRRLTADPAKLPKTALARYGNLSSASIPAAICVAAEGRGSAGLGQSLCYGFGVGLSWGGALLNLSGVKCLAVEPFQSPP